jgi:hypothetical protein
VNIISDGVAPTVDITSPSTGNSIDGEATVTGSCSDNTLVTGVYICIDGKPIGEASLDGCNWTYQLDTSHFANGPDSLSAMVMDEDQNIYEQGISINVTGNTLQSVAAAKNLEDGQQARLDGRVVTLGVPGYEDGFYIEEINRFAGIRIEGESIPAEGDKVSISGIMSTIAGERAVVGADVVVTSSSNPLPMPLGLSNVFLGGGHGPHIPGISGGVGLSNLGLLVRAWGYITKIGDGCMYINDGSDIKDGTFIDAEECVGVRVICDTTGYAVGEFVEITGICASFDTPAGLVARQILTRRVDDIRKLLVP